jgi:hypothetical protein
MRSDRGIPPAAARATLDRAEMDVSATHRVADRFDAAAEVIDGAAAEHLTQLEFGGHTAGREHAARGDALHAALHRLAAEASRWARVCTEVAVALRDGADGYSEAEMCAAARIA